MILPRFADLCKDLQVEQESLVLPPLRNFPESCSKPYPPADQRRQGHAIGSYQSSLPSSRSAIPRLTIPYGSPLRDDDYSSRGSSPSDDNSSDLETEELESPRDSSHAVLFLPQQSQSPPLTSPGQTKVKKVKYHPCPLCQKAFPRPSGLRAHMNMHTKEKPFECGFPGCSKRFSVSSNAKRHLRTHGVGLTPSDDPSPLPYVVDFEEPVVVAMESDRDDPYSSSEPVSLRWMPLGAGSRRSCRAMQQTGGGDP